MEITEVRIKLMEDSDDRLQAFCSITFDDAFVIRDLKIIDGTNGPFVAMPSRKLTAHCLYCRSKNHLRAAYCNQCGKRLREERAPRDAEGRAKLYADIAHPINPQCREVIQNRVIAEFKAELARADEPGYASRYDEDYELVLESEVDDQASPPAAVPPPTAASVRAAEIGDRSQVLPPPPRRVEEHEPAASKRADSRQAVSTHPASESESEPRASRDRSHTTQPPEQEPRAPHQTPKKQPVDEPPPPRSTTRPGRGEFGAGIFE